LQQPFDFRFVPDARKPTFEPIAEEGYQPVTKTSRIGDEILECSKKSSRNVFWGCEERNAWKTFRGLRAGMSHAFGVPSATNAEQ